MTHRLFEHPDLPRWLQRELATGRADRHWRDWFVPQLAYGRHAGPARKDSRRAAVAIVLYRQNSVWHVPLTVRPTSLRTHAGQVSFPGGGLEPCETSQEAAHRELVEELYAAVHSPESIRVEWLGALDPLHVFVSNALVTPWIGVLYDCPDWHPEPAEVQQVLPLSLEFLLADTEPDRMTVRRGSLSFAAPRLPVERFEVWGSTAILLGELRGWLQRVAAKQES